MKEHLCILLFLIVFNPLLKAEDGYELWLNYQLIENQEIVANYQTNQFSTISMNVEKSPIVQSIRNELTTGLGKLLGTNIRFSNKNAGIRLTINEEIVSAMDGFQIKDSNHAVNEIDLQITAQSDKGLLYGTFRFLQFIQQGKTLDNITFNDAPKTDLRILNHWDNLDGTVERGYAGFSIFDWHKLPEYKHKRYTDYARANASIGINATVVTNVNANALVLRDDYLEKVAALADIFRKYGIKIYLTARFSAPIELGGLDTADPLNEEVQQWWQQKTDEIYGKIPDFGGFLVKANSEGQPGPQDYGRTHAEGANMLADALAKHNGIVMWRAFVYSEDEPDDRAKQAFDEFTALDGQFRDNVIIQIKNGPIDFQPREPIHPLFGGLKETNGMMEFQITQEYLGQGTHLVFLPEMYEEVLQTDTYQFGKGSTVATILEGKYNNQQLTAIAGVANIGTARNWTGHLFGQANWYGFGRLTWDPEITADTIAREWTELTFATNSDASKTIQEILAMSYEAVVNYMTPLGLHHIMATGHHYGPGPWVDNLSRADWNPVYYHKADEQGVGFDRTKSGSNAIGQYHPKLAKEYLTDERFLLWFQHVDWDEELKNGKSLWWNLVDDYNRGVNSVEQMIEKWNSVKHQVDSQRFQEVSMLFNIQLKEAKWWRDACLAYFQQFAQQPIPNEFPEPEHELEYYKQLNHPYAPGIRPQW